jgi:hypothetical protein
VLAYARDHLNTYRIPCSAVAAAVARSKAKDLQQFPGEVETTVEKSRSQAVPDVPPKP